MWGTVEPIVRLTMNINSFTISLNPKVDPKLQRRLEQIIAHSSSIGASKVAARPGFEPGSKDSKSFVLPLHYRAVKKRITKA